MYYGVSSIGKLACVCPLCVPTQVYQDRHAKHTPEYRGYMMTVPGTQYMYSACAGTLSGAS